MYLVVPGDRWPDVQPFAAVFVRRDGVETLLGWIDDVEQDDAPHGPVTARLTTDT